MPLALLNPGCRIVHVYFSGVARRKPKDLPEFQRINTVLGNLKTRLSDSYHAIGFRKYAARYLAAFSCCFNRQFDLSALNKRLLVAAVDSVG
jgi:hypothetical protein